MSSPIAPARAFIDAIWTGFKVLVLVAGFGIAFMPDEIRPVAWTIAKRLLSEGAVVSFLVAFGAMLVTTLVVAIAGHMLLRDDDAPS